MLFFFPPFDRRRGSFLYGSTPDGLIAIPRPPPPPPPSRTPLKFFLLFSFPYAPRKSPRIRENLCSLLLELPPEPQCVPPTILPPFGAAPLDGSSLEVYWSPSSVLGFSGRLGVYPFALFLFSYFFSLSGDAVAFSGRFIWLRDMEVWVHSLFLILLLDFSPIPPFCRLLDQPLDYTKLCVFL